MPHSFLHHSSSFNPHCILLSLIFNPLKNSTANHTVNPQKINSKTYQENTLPVFPRSHYPKTNKASPHVYAPDHPSTTQTPDPSLSRSQPSIASPTDRNRLIKHKQVTVSFHSHHKKPLLILLLRSSHDYHRRSRIPAAGEAPPPATEESNKPKEKTKKKKPAREKKLNDLKEPKKKPKQHTKVTKPKTADSHPPYFQMIKEALLALKQKSGSSPYAIAKYMKEKHKALPGNFRKTLTLQLKNSEARGKLTKVNASYKLTEAGKKDKSVEKRTTRDSSKPKKEEKKKGKSNIGAAKKKKIVKPKQPKSIKSPAAKKPKKAAA